MCGKKSNVRENAHEDSRKEFLESSLFFYEYLNNTLNYVLSGRNDLDHSLHFDLAALKQIASSGPLEENVHFVERVKMMKTRCDPNTYIKDVQEYGEFINYQISRAHTQEINGMEVELREELDIGMRLKRIKRRLKITDERLTLYQIEQLDKQINADIMADLIQQQTSSKPAEIDQNLDGNRLYREMFNIQEGSSVKKEEKAEIKKDKPRQRGPKRKTEEYLPPKSQPEKMLIEEKVKREDPIQKPSIRFFNSQPKLPPILPQIPLQAIQAPQSAQLPSQPVQPSTQLPPPPAITTGPRSINNIEMKLPSTWSVPMKAVPQPTSMMNEMKAQIEQIKTPAPKQPEKIENILQQQEAKYAPIPASLEAKSSSGPQKKKRKEKKIEKEEKEERQVRKRGPKPQLNKQKHPERQKRPYNKKKKLEEQQRVLSQVNPINQIIAPPVIIYDRKANSRQIGIQADANEDLQNLKVISPRPQSFLHQNYPQQVSQPPQPTQPPAQPLPPQHPHPQQAFIFEPLRPNPPPPPINITPAPININPPLERREILLERQQIKDSEVREPERPDISASQRIQESRLEGPLRKESDLQEMRMDEFDDISRYLV